MKNFASEKTPTTTKFWKNLDDKNRKKLIINEISKIDELKDFEVSQVLSDGQIIFRVTKSIPLIKEAIFF